MDSNQEGNINQKAVELELEKLGALVYNKSGEGGKVDFLFTFDYKKWYRIQSKKASIYPSRSKGTLWIKSIGHTRKDQKLISYDYVGVVDFISGYYAALDKCYLIPIDKVGKRGITLRLLPTKNGQKKGINWAKDFELEKIIESLRS